MMMPNVITEYNHYCESCACNNVNMWYIREIFSFYVCLCVCVYLWNIDIDLQTFYVCKCLDFSRYSSSQSFVIHFIHIKSIHSYYVFVFTSDNYFGIAFFFVLFCFVSNSIFICNTHKENFFVICHFNIKFCQFHQILNK